MKELETLQIINSFNHSSCFFQYFKIRAKMPAKPSLKKYCLFFSAYHRLLLVKILIFSTLKLINHTGLCICKNYSRSVITSTILSEIYVIPNLFCQFIFNPWSIGLNTTFLSKSLKTSIAHLYSCLTGTYRNHFSHFNFIQNLFIKSV